MALRSWGQLPAAPAASEVWWRDREAPLPVTGMSLLPYGNGRSYGDVGLNSGGLLLHTRGMDRFIAFDENSGVLVCEAGVLLSEILDVFVPRGWFLPVTPGTRFVTVGGAIANDVHSKNQHGAGTFGNHVEQLELRRSDGSCRMCSRREHADWFAATIGGLGLTGMITRAAIRLKRIPGVNMTVCNTRFAGLEAFFSLNAALEREHEYTVAWLDCLAATPRGIFMAGDHASGAGRAQSSGTPLSVPITPPLSLVNKFSLWGFNQAYFYRPLPRRKTVPYAPFFYPLDGVLHWNRIYGRRGFYQYQFVLPMRSREALADVLRAIAQHGQGSFLAVLKTFGDKQSDGMLSFPMPGVTLALDFPNRGKETLRLFDRLDAIIEAAGGRLYAAKDARMQGAFFRRSYPRFDEFLSYIDPKFSSDFLRRIVQ